MRRSEVVAKTAHRASTHLAFFNLKRNSRLTADVVVVAGPSVVVDVIAIAAGIAIILAVVDYAANDAAKTSMQAFGCTDF